MTITPELQPKSEPESLSETYRRRALMASIAIGLSLAATLGANEAAENKTKIPESVTYELPNGQTIGTSVETGTFDVMPGNETARLPGIEFSTGTRNKPSTATEHIHPETDIQLMEWARKFDLDPASVEINPNGPAAIETATNKVHQLKNEGWTIDRITIQGFASDEGDDREGENPGFGLPTNEKNIKLANKRADAVRAMFEQKLNSGLNFASNETVAYPITSIEGEEVRNDQLATNIEAVANKFNMPTDEMVMQFNRDPETLPVEAREVLEGLYDDRFVRIEIEASREVAIPGEETRDSIILIPIFIPLFRRRPEPTAPANTPHPTMTKPKTIRKKFPHPPRDLGNTHPGYSQMTHKIKQPDTSNAHYGKGSGGRVGASRHTQHRGHHH